MAERWRLLLRCVLLAGVLALSRARPGGTRRRDLGDAAVPRRRGLAEGGLDCSDIALLHKVHMVTPGLLERLAKAKEQLDECGGYYRVLYIRQDEPANLTAAALDIKALQGAVGPGVVLPIGPPDFALVFGMEWGKLKKHDWLAESAKEEENATTGSFAWHHCDAPELVWYTVFAKKLPPAVEHVWVSEWDVGWLGSLPGILATFPREADYVCSTGTKTSLDPKEGWKWLSARTWLSDDKEVKQCYVMLTRYSFRLLSVFQVETKMRHFSFCESTVATMCARHSLWCSIHTFDKNSKVLAHNRHGRGMFGFSLKLDRQAFANLVKEIGTDWEKEGPGLLVHAVKY